VALIPIPEEEFAGSPVVGNASNIRNGTNNHHGIARYLNKAEVVYAAATGT
jgi:hypothetical protein